LDQVKPDDDDDDDDDIDWEVVSTHLEFLTIKSNLDPVERHVVLGAMHALKDHLIRAESSKDKEYRDSGFGSNRKFSARELLSEAERVLMKAASGLSLLERLRRDA
jgi:hypothetical protein